MPKRPVLITNPTGKSAAPEKRSPRSQWVSSTPGTMNSRSALAKWTEG
jgi:hypothetical protein